LIARADVPIIYYGVAHADHDDALIAAHIGGFARASYASGGGGTSRVPRIAGDVTAGLALVNCVLVSYAPCVERRRF
jgi:hypothetical protein